MGPSLADLLFSFYNDHLFLLKNNPFVKSIKNIVGNRCAEFDSEGSIVQENSNKCNNALVPCPMVYKSTEAFKCKKSFLSSFIIFLLRFLL